MSENLINEITLDFLMNKDQYKKYILQKSSKKEHIKDIKFYRKRIYYLTKELLLSKEQTKPLLPEVKNAFDNYIKTCINYFKTIDSNDIIQEDYKDFLCDVNELDEDTVMDTVMDTITDTKENPDNYLMRKINVKKNSLDGFVKKKINKPKEIILPKEKNINLKDPLLKNKGISKKKNINNKYEDTEDNKKIPNIDELNEKTKVFNENEKEKNVS
jgi:hypothetical protein